MSRLAFLISRLRRRIWLVPALLTLLALLSPVLAWLIGHNFSLLKKAWIGQETLVLVMQVLAGSMLPVATFSVMGMISAFHAISANASPRATDLAVADPGSQFALGAFIGAFLFAVVSLIGLRAEFYQATGTAVLSVITLCVIVFVAATLVRWIDHVSKLGLMSSVIARLERATGNAFRAYRRLPTRPTDAARFQQGVPVGCRRNGYVQQVDIAGIERVASRLGVAVHVLCAPGDPVCVGTPVALVTGDGMPDDDATRAIADAFAIGDSRTFESDPRFGLAVLSEIAERALSSAVNDPGTAVAVIDVAERVLTEWLRNNEADGDRPAPVNVTLPMLSPSALLEDAFRAIARDGAGKVEIALRLQRAFANLACLDDAPMAAACDVHARIAARRAFATLTLEEDRAALAAAIRRPTGVDIDEVEG